MTPDTGKQVDIHVDIKENIERIKERVEKAARKSGRSPDEIKLIAVTKNVEPARILEAIDAGIWDLGENRVQEMQEKVEAISTAGRKVNWHMIGHLQKNKVKYLVDSVSIIHSLDSIELAQEIDKRAKKVGRIINVLIQVNVAEEESKFGIFKDEVNKFIEDVVKYDNIRVKGLMTIAPKAANPEDVRFVFRELNKIFIDIKSENIDNIYMDYLSMGMSNDFEIAVEEGSNMVRIGTSIFGKRI